MVRRSFWIYIEGGGDGKTADAAFRQGWRRFLSSLDELARVKGFLSLQVVRGKDRSQTYRMFVGHNTIRPQEPSVLLVDSEGALAIDTDPWTFVATRSGDNWKRPDWATREHLYFMVHFVETWLVSDPDALEFFFKRGFNRKRLPTINLETKSKTDIEQALKKATKDTPKGAYRHGQAHEIIGLVDPERVKTLNHGQRLFDGVTELINKG